MANDIKSLLDSIIDDTNNSFQKNRFIKAKNISASLQIILLAQ